MPSSHPTLLIVDDEASIRRLLRRCFETESYNVLEASCGAELFEHLAQHPVDLITLDLTLGDEDGLALAREIRVNSAIPIIMVSGKGELIDTVVGLEVGADDYISKPFELREVLARVRSLLRRTRNSPKSSSADSATMPSSEQPVFLFGKWTLSPHSRALTSTADDQCELTTNEFDLLEIFVRNPYQVMSRDQLMDKLKGQNWNPNDRSIDNQIARLRKKLEQHESADVIKTVRGVGYLFSADVKKV